jgi:hypothetical protein
MKNYFRVSSPKKGRKTLVYLNTVQKVESQIRAECHKKELYVVHGLPSIVTEQTTYDELGTVSGTEKKGHV